MIGKQVGITTYLLTDLTCYNEYYEISMYVVMHRNFGFIYTGCMQTYA
jgi:hypothetical protein